MNFPYPQYHYEEDTYRLVYTIKGTITNYNGRCLQYKHGTLPYCQVTEHGQQQEAVLGHEYPLVQSADIPTLILDLCRLIP